MSRRRLPVALMRRRPAPSSWSPSSLVGLSAWWRADSGTFQDTAASLGASAGEPVGAWIDRAGSAATLQQGTSGKRPTRQDSGPNGTPVLVFDGVNDFLSATLTRASTEAVYAVGRFATSANQTMLDCPPGNSRRLYSDSGSGSFPPTFYSAGGFIVPTNPVSVGAWFAMLVQCDGSASSIRVAGVATAGTLGPSGDGLVIGTYGDTSFGVTLFQGGLAEVLVVGGRVLTSGEVDELAAYTLQRYGLTL